MYFPCERVVLSIGFSPLFVSYIGTVLIKCSAFGFFSFPSLDCVDDGGRDDDYDDEDDEITPNGGVLVVAVQCCAFHRLLHDRALLPKRRTSATGILGLLPPLAPHFRSMAQYRAVLCDLLVSRCVWYPVF